MRSTALLCCHTGLREGIRLSPSAGKNDQWAVLFEEESPSSEM